MYAYAQYHQFGIMFASSNILGLKLVYFRELITRMVLRAKRGGPGLFYIIGHYTDRNQNYVVRCVAFSQRQGKFVDVIFGLFT